MGFVRHRAGPSHTNHVLIPEMMLIAGAQHELPHDPDKDRGEGRGQSAHFGVEVSPKP